MRTAPRNHSLIALLTTSVFALGLFGCSDGAGTGAVTVGIADAPVDNAEHVYVEFTSVEIHGGGGTTVVDYGTDGGGNPVTKQIDLLALQGGLRDFLLQDHILGTGQYNWLRLSVNAEADGVYDSYIVIDGSPYELHIPSGSETGLKLNTPFNIYSGQTTDFTIDFDLRKSVHNPAGQVGPLGPVYLLRPTLRLLDSNETGRITGTLDPNIFSGLLCSAPELGYAVYAFTGSGISPDDVDGIEPEPVNSAMVEYVDSEYHYTLSFLSPGDYTVAATCQADSDDPAQDNQLNFVGNATVSVSAGADTVHPFNP